MYLKKCIYIYFIILLSIRRGVSISTPAANEKDRRYVVGGISTPVPSLDKKEKRHSLEICGLIINETLLIEGSSLDFTASGFEYHKYRDPHRNLSRILAHYRSETENLTTILGDVWCKLL